jgi:hypothetical protein
VAPRPALGEKPAHFRTEPLALDAFPHAGSDASVELINFPVPENCAASATRSRQGKGSGLSVQPPVFLVAASLHHRSPEFVAISARLAGSVVLQGHAAHERPPPH